MCSHAGTNKELSFYDWGEGHLSFKRTSNQAIYNGKVKEKGYV